MEELTGKCYLTVADGAQRGAGFAEVLFSPVRTKLSRGAENLMNDQLHLT